MLFHRLRTTLGGGGVAGYFSLEVRTTDDGLEVQLHCCVNWVYVFDHLFVVENVYYATSVKEDLLVWYTIVVYVVHIGVI